MDSQRDMGCVGTKHYRSARDRKIKIAWGGYLQFMLPFICIVTFINNFSRRVGHARKIWNSSYYREKKSSIVICRFSGRLCCQVLFIKFIKVHHSQYLTIVIINTDVETKQLFCLMCSKVTRKLAPQLSISWCSISKRSAVFIRVLSPRICSITSTVSRPDPPSLTTNLPNPLPSDPLLHSGLLLLRFLT